MFFQKIPTTTAPQQSSSLPLLSSSNPPSVPGGPKCSRGSRKMCPQMPVEALQTSASDPLDLGVHKNSLPSVIIWTFSAIVDGHVWFLQSVSQSIVHKMFFLLQITSPKHTKKEATNLLQTSPRNSSLWWRVATSLRTISLLESFSAIHPRPAARAEPSHGTPNKRIVLHSKSGWNPKVCRWAASAGRTPTLRNNLCTAKDEPVVNFSLCKSETLLRN